MIDSDSDSGLNGIDSGIGIDSGGIKHKSAGHKIPLFCTIPTQSAPIEDLVWAISIEATESVP